MAFNYAQINCAGTVYISRNCDCLSLFFGSSFLFFFESHTLLIYEHYVRLCAFLVF